MCLLTEFEKTTKKSWSNIQKAKTDTAENIAKIQDELHKVTIPLMSSDTSLVFFGSMARGECTAQSDVDWTLLVDGQADPNHVVIAQTIEKAIQKTGLTEPGKTGMFGQTTFSHDLIHYIGGQDDKNHNLSRRILLLLESVALNSSRSDETAYKRVVAGIVNKYVNNDSGYNASSGKENVPRFLLNDIIRFWRTMCVDFAYKQIEQQGQKWALRNIKLRMSRRLIYVKGLLLCAAIYKSDYNKAEIIEHLCDYIREEPLDFLIKQFVEYNIDKSVLIEILNSYDLYLEMLNNKAERDHLSTLDMTKAYNDSIFEKARNNSHKFQNALNRVFLFNPKTHLCDFAINYGIF